MLNTNNPRTRVGLLFVLAFIPIGLTDWNALPLRLTGRAVEAATHTGHAAETPRSATGAVANGRIAFISSEPGSVNNVDIYTMNPDGSDRRRLTFDPAQDRYPAWSPDGTKIAFAKSVSLGDLLPGQIYVMNAGGGDQRRLTEPGGDRYYRHPTWSPDGTKIAFQNAIGDNRGGVIVMNADGSGQRTIFQGRFDNPAWSPDGTKLIGSSGYDGLVLIDVDGSNLTWVTQAPTPFDFADFEPAWSPDGTKIVFTRYSDCDINDCYTSRLYVINSDGSNLTGLTRQNNLGFGPAWSPDGRKIVFGGNDLYAINPDGSGLTTLTNTNHTFEFFPSWQPLSSPQTANPIDDPQFFVRQHYLDFLSREPETSGFHAWLGVLNGCADIFTGPEVPSGCDRIAVSSAFFQSPEFQIKGLYTLLFYRVAFGRLPEYSEITPEMSALSGQTPEEVYQKRAAYATSFAARPEFTNLYGGMTDQQYVDALLGRYNLQQVTTEDPASPEGTGQVTLTRQLLPGALANNSLTRAQVLRAVVQSAEVDASEYHGAFVAMQYYGYLRRTPEPDGYDAWLRVIRQDPSNIRLMVNGFVNSQEYRLRFGQP